MRSGAKRRAARRSGAERSGAERFSVRRKLVDEQQPRLVAAKRRRDRTAGVLYFQAVGDVVQPGEPLALQDGLQVVQVAGPLGDGAANGLEVALDVYGLADSDLLGAEGGPLDGPPLAQANQGDQEGVLADAALAPLPVVFQLGHPHRAAGRREVAGRLAVLHALRTGAVGRHRAPPRGNDRSLYHHGRTLLGGARGCARTVVGTTGTTLSGERGNRTPVSAMRMRCITTMQTAQGYDGRV